MSRAFILENGKASEAPFGEAAARFGEADLIWLHLDGREKEAQVWIEAQDDIPPLARFALTASETRPRSDGFGQGALVNLRGLGKTPDDDPDALVSTRFWAETGRVVSLAYRSPLALDDVAEQFLAAAILDPGDLITVWAGRITAGLDPEVAALGDRLDELETRLESEGLYKMRRDVSRIRGDAIGYRRFVSPQRIALDHLATTPCEWLDDDDRMHLREAADRFARMAEELESVRERSAIVHEELTDLRAEQMDVRALFISVIALIFLPLTFVTGLFGMNFDYIPFQHDHYGFDVVLWGSFAVAAAMTTFFVRRHWLER